ncbi:Hypothetical predicted protein [Olea europaea subsp. europaea]|uniref:Uncharacterized protein n=1 Tax=Olea europaea subsp. europaea TaxID=158383 RepID=A0A8S0VBP4_OLEEU|nr:Hypothetical predicted protein [Olea europaea subsp. europaea]
MDYTIARSKEPSFFQETASFGQNQIIDNSVLFDSQLEEIHGFEENDLFDWSDAFNTESENPHLMVVSKEENHELLTTAPTLKSLNPCSGLTESENPHLMVVSKEDSHELLTTAPTLKSLNPCNGLTGTYQDFQSSTPAMNSSTPGNELVDTFSMAYNGELNQFTPPELNSFSPGSHFVNFFSLPCNLDFQQFTPNWNWFEDSAFLDDMNSWCTAANNLWT